MNEHKILIVPIEPAMIDRLVLVHMKAFTGYMNTRMGPNYVRSFLNWFRRDPEGIALAALLDNAPVGYLVGAPLGYQRRMNKDLFLIVAKAVACRPWLLLSKGFLGTIWGRLQNLFGFMDSNVDESILASPCVSLVGICTSPEARGRNMGSALMAAFEAEAKRRGVKALRLSVYETNQAARCLYSKMGWTAFSSSEHGELYYAKLLNID